MNGFGAPLFAPGTQSAEIDKHRHPLAEWTRRCIFASIEQAAWAPDFLKTWGKRMHYSWFSELSTMAKQNGCYCLGCLCQVSRQVSSSYDTLGDDRISFRGIVPHLGKDLRLESCWTICSSRSWLTLVNFHGVVARKLPQLFGMQVNKPGLFGLWPTERCCAIKSDVAKLRTMFSLKRAWQAIKPLWVQTHKQGVQTPSDEPSRATITYHYLSAMENGMWWIAKRCKQSTTT